MQKKKNTTTKYVIYIVDKSENNEDGLICVFDGIEFPVRTRRVPSDRYRRLEPRKGCVTYPDGTNYFVKYPNRMRNTNIRRPSGVSLLVIGILLYVDCANPSAANFFTAINPRSFTEVSSAVFRSSPLSAVARGVSVENKTFRGS